jgi:aminodeoxyfutalosine deaminase
VQVYRAQWLLPIVAPPVRDGWVSISQGQVHDVGSGRPPRGRGVQTHDLGRAAVLPGLVNAHTHLELSWLWGRVKPARSLPEWVDALMAIRGAATGDDPLPIGPAIEAAQEAGTAAVGDVSNTLVSVEPLARSGMRAVVFHELIGFNPADPRTLVVDARQKVQRTACAAHVTISLAAHAPYSVAPGLLAEIAADARRNAEPTSIHIGESAEEHEFLAHGDGAWRQLLERRGVWNPAWAPPRCGPVEYLERCHALGPETLAVHGVQLSDRELRLLAARGATLVTCPRSNVWVGVGNPPIERFYRARVPVAFGTDSLASATDLNLFNEIAAAHHLAPRIRPARLLESATRIGARALGLKGYGVIQRGARARLIAVDLPMTVGDVERYLCEGVDPSQIAWVTPAPAA